MSPAVPARMVSTFPPENALRKQRAMILEREVECGEESKERKVHCEHQGFSRHAVRMLSKQRRRGVCNASAVPRSPSCVEKAYM